MGQQLLYSPFKIDIKIGPHLNSDKETVGICVCEY